MSSWQLRASVRHADAPGVAAKPASVGTRPGATTTAAFEASVEKTEATNAAPSLRRGAAAPGRRIGSPFIAVDHLAHHGPRFAAAPPRLHDARAAARPAAGLVLLMFTSPARARPIA
jgi:hypothetical protein